MCFVMLNSVIFNLSCVSILFYNASSHSCFRFFEILNMFSSSSAAKRLRNKRVGGLGGTFCVKYASKMFLILLTTLHPPSLLIYSGHGVQACHKQGR